MVAPFACPYEYVAKLKGSEKKAKASFPKNRHVIWRMMEWEEKLVKTPGLTVTQIGEEEGLRSRRAGQLFRLTRLVPEIREFLCELSDERAIRFFCEARLRGLTKLDAASQQLKFAEMLREWEGARASDVRE